MMMRANATTFEGCEPQALSATTGTTNSVCPALTQSSIAWSTVDCCPLSRLIESPIDTACVWPPPPPLPHVGTRLFSLPALAERELRLVKQELSVGTWKSLVTEMFRQSGES